MPEYDFGLPPRNSDRSFSERARSIWDWFITPDGEGGLIPPTVTQAVVEELEDQGAGRAGNSGPETKGIQKSLEKLIRGGPLGEAVLDVLFGDSKVGAPDPAGNFDKPFVDSEGRTYQFDAAGNLVLVQMLPMWTADP